MADAVTTNVIFSGRRRYVARFTNVSDGTGESAVKKVDVSTLVGPDGTPPTHTVIEWVEYDIQGFTDVRLLFDATTDDTAVILGPGQGSLDFTGYGGLKDPKSSGTTGDIMLTTTGAASGDTYTITLALRLKD